MHDASLTGSAANLGTGDPSAADIARFGDAVALALALAASRRDTLATFAVYEAACPDLVVPLREELNPPLWELGHIGWFQEYWLARFDSHAQGAAAEPDVPRHPPPRADADRLYNSSHVPHDTRWGLPLPDAAATRDDLARQLARTLGLLRQAGPDDDALYFYRLALAHEDMHHEAALYMAQALGIAIADARWQARPLPEPGQALTMIAGTWQLGSAANRGFAFDNELGAHEVTVPALEIDTQVVRWAEYLPFVDGGGHAQASWWTPDGLRWRDAQPSAAPRYLRRAGAVWQQWRHGRWRVLDLSLAACHLSAHEARAWCCWAGRRLPTEAEWERAAVLHPQRLRWGDVWEWTASAFAPYPGFCPHPYRDYSAPWFDDRPVLRGASHMTQPRLRHPRYRNYFLPHRNDVPTGFRSCAL